MMEIIPQSGLQKSLKGKRKARDSEVTTTSSIGISTADEPTVFNKITLEDNDLEYSSDDFDAPVTKDPFWVNQPSLLLVSPNQILLLWSQAQLLLKQT
ncbi:hypothetical protein RO3G_00384 [Rhizopus delemar RA 99-880]|uniref:Uncharacterized protein n=1 Tax=Rhizopus delemar (strain RA 99-880 / ATCC MYA-4621 / FGSC 9543 / NRRL 43880) TaxID=246409 RepID=I1BHK0_RHIO9|nr:hypothetical protein RO3G_00384 [Rhizopus delemar RA 99-880]|eukprot:EIE75680.1 hypothetical protein RO3G_00384 [Rhizopus delemar RA 99-880]